MPTSRVIVPLSPSVTVIGRYVSLQVPFGVTVKVELAIDAVTQSDD